MLILITNRDYDILTDLFCKDFSNYHLAISHLGSPMKKAVKYISIKAVPKGSFKEPLISHLSVLFMGTLYYRIPASQSGLRLYLNGKPYDPREIAGLFFDKWLSIS